MKIAGLDLTFNREGYPFIAITVVVTLLLGFFCGEELFSLGLILTAWCFYFFRDPARVTPVKPGLIISPADGKIVAIENLDPEESLGLGDALRYRISIFLNVFDVHVNRMPADGKVVARNYRKGTFVNASLNKASTDNERMALALELSGEHKHAGEKLGVVQIAGFVARRIVCSAQEGNGFQAGQRYGIIRFGSRVDVYLPPKVSPLVTVGQYMIGGETVLADCASEEPAHTAERRD
jgi:phosphatidylserine decarboxylase